MTTFLRAIFTTALLALALPAAAGVITDHRGTVMVGTRGSDILLSNGTSGESLVGGDGNDVLRGTIPSALLANPDAPWTAINLYGGVFLPSAREAHGMPAVSVAGFDVSIGGLDNDGDDWVDGGCGYRSKGGSGADTYFNHGFGCPMRQDCPPLATVTPTHACPFETLFDAPAEGDRFYFTVGSAKGCAKGDTACLMGFKISNIVYTQITAKDGKSVLRVGSFLMEMTGPLRQTQVVGFEDDKRGPASAHLVDVPYNDTSVTRPDTIRAMLYAAATPGRQAADLGGAPAQWLFALRSE